MLGLSLSRLTDQIDPAAAKVAARAAIFMPICFILAGVLLGDAARPFASFGAFILLAMVTFAGRPLPRLVAWVTLVITGCAFIAVGTYLSQYTVIAAASAGLLAFLVFFSGVVNPYFAAARNGAILLIALPLMVEAEPSMVGERLTGWLLACLICIPATYLVWRLPWFGDLRRQAARTSRALARLVRDPSSGELREQASEDVWKLRKRYLSTPNRPTGATGVSAAIANLVDEQGWTYGLVVNPGSGIENDRQCARELRSETADLLEQSADLLLGKADSLSVETAEAALERLIQQNAEDLREEAALHEGEEKAEAVRHIDHEFRLRKLAFSVIDIAETVEVASGKTRAPGALGEVWSWAAALGRKQAKGAGHLIAEHAGLDSSWLRNSVRGAIGIALAVLVADLVAVQNAFWVVLGTLSILRSNALGTRGSVVQALFGTLIGIIAGSLFIWVFGDMAHVLWVALPITVLVASYAQRAVSFAAGQAGFAMLVMVLYNLIEPAGWELGLVRIENVAIGCGVSLAVGLLVWPRGAASMIRGSIEQALVSAAELVRDRAVGVLEGRRGNTTDSLWHESEASSELLDAALRRFLDESSGDHIDRESLMALSAAGLRLRRTAFGIGQIPDQPWFSAPGVAESPKLAALVNETCDAYIELGRAIASGEPVPATPDFGDVSWLLDEFGDRDGDEMGAGLARIWLFENLQYLTELHHRFSERAAMLFDVSSENPPPTGDIPMPRPSGSPQPTAT